MFFIAFSLAGLAGFAYQQSGNWRATGMKDERILASGDYRQTLIRQPVKSTVYAFH